MKAKVLAQNAMSMAEAVIREKGSMATMILLHTSNRELIILPYKTGVLPVQLEQIAIITIIRSCRAAKQFDGLVLVAEAWTAKVEKQELVGVLMPSQDPDRKEIVIARCYGDDHVTKTVTADIIRDGGSVRLGSHEESLADVKSWLDEAFED